MIRSIALVALLAGTVLLDWAPAAYPDVPNVEPAELTRRPDLVGKDVAVEDRVMYFTPHSEELRLKRTPVVFRLPPKLRTLGNGQTHVVWVQGILSKVGNDFYCDVTDLRPLPRDLERLKQEVNALAPNDYAKRAAWARWAEGRGAAFDDEELKARAVTLEAEAIEIEADRAETADRPALWLRLAQQARERKVYEPVPSTLAHRAFRARLAEAKTAADLERLLEQIEAFFPKAKTPPLSQSRPPSLPKTYSVDPEGVYRRATGPVRAALDRKLLADALVKSFEVQAAAKAKDGTALRALAAQARMQLTDLPEVADQLEDRGLEAAAMNLSELRKDEMLELSKALAERGQPDRAVDLKRRWLDDMRLHRLSSTDADGRISLAKQYNELLGDRAMAKALLEDALRIDPKYRDAEEALRQMGFRKVNDAWIEAGQARAATNDPAAEQGGSTGGGPLQGLTFDQVRAKMGGKPDQIARVASQGQVVEQWIYRGLNRTQYINFTRRPNMSRPTVEAYYSLASDQAHSDSAPLDQDRDR